MLMFSFDIPLFLRLVKLVIRINVEHKTETEQKFGKDKNNSHFIFVLSHSLCPIIHKYCAFERLQLLQVSR